MRTSFWKFFLYTLLFFVNNDNSLTYFMKLIREKSDICQKNKIKKFLRNKNNDENNCIKFKSKNFLKKYL